MGAQKVPEGWEMGDILHSVVLIYPFSIRSIIKIAIICINTPCT